MLHNFILKKSNNKQGAAHPESCHMEKGKALKPYGPI